MLMEWLVPVVEPVAKVVPAPSFQAKLEVTVWLSASDLATVQVSDVSWVPTMGVLSRVTVEITGKLLTWVKTLSLVPTSSSSVGVTVQVTCSPSERVPLPTQFDTLIEWVVPAPVVKIPESSSLQA